jgi:aspartate--ammonia ligase
MTESPILGAQARPAPLNLLETETAIFFIKQAFQKKLARALRLHRVSAPLFVSRDSGMQDTLSGNEKPVAFAVKGMNNQLFEIVHSLAKWKRYALYRYRIPEDEGLYTDMNALRPDEESLTTGIHSVYVDQWDWERHIGAPARTLFTLRQAVEAIYDCLREMELEIETQFAIPACLPESITFVHSENLAANMPDKTPRERENEICRRHGAVFLIGIGGLLPDGGRHDGRAPDYDDWSTPTGPDTRGLNGDILVWNPVSQSAFELSSMGIRVNADGLRHQTALSGCTDRLQTPWHQLLLDGKLPESIGGGIGQSRLCMFLLRKRHIGEVQSSIWPDWVTESCLSRGIELL